jgi:hypothetical protein
MCDKGTVASALVLAENHLGGAVMEKPLTAPVHYRTPELTQHEPLRAETTNSVGGRV